MRLRGLATGAALAAALAVTAAPPAAAREAGEEAAKAPEPVEWKTRAELSYVSTSGNSDNETFAGKLEVKREGPVNRYYLTGSYLREESDDRETANKLTTSATWERVLTDRLFALLTAGYLRDRFSGYEFRAYAGPGVGYEFIRTERHKVRGTATVLYYHDEFSKGTKSTDDYLSGKLAGAWRWKVTDRVDFSEELSYLVPLDDTERFFIDSTTSVEVKVNGAVSIGFNYIVNYQNEPPSEDVTTTDTTFLTTLIIDF